MDIPNQLTSTTTPMKRQPSIPSSNSSLKKKIMCKFFIMGNCIKGDSCFYLHSEEEKTKMISKPSIECPMYSLGCCKNGPMCKYQHIKIDSISASNESVSEYPELPIWYLEHYFDKPIELIFSEFERQNAEEVKELKEKYGMNKKKQYSNYQYDVYADKKDTIIYHLNQKINYYLLKCANYSSIRFSMEHNMIITPTEFVDKYQEERRIVDNIILVILDMETMNYSGFVLCKKKIESNEELLNSMRHRDRDREKNQMSHPQELKEGFSYIKIEWLWRTKLHYTKLVHMINPFNNIQSNCEELSLEIGFYACRMMIKRLSKDEVRDLVKQKQSQEEEDGGGGDYYSRDNNENHEVCPQSLLPTISNIPSSSHHFQQIVHSQSEDKKVYVTNINNLQVNINNNTTNHYEHTHYQRRKREKERERSRSKRQYNQRRDYDNQYHSNRYHKESSYSKYHHKEKEFRPQITFHRENNSRTKMYMKKDAEMNMHKPYKNKLFSNAMDKINAYSSKRG